MAETHFLKDTSLEAQENVIINRMSMGTVALQQNYYEEALSHYFKVIDHFEKGSSQDWPNLVTAYANIGLVYNDMRQFDKALLYHKRALSIFEGKNIDEKKKAQVQMLIAIDMLNLKQYEEFHTTMDSTEHLVRRLNSNYLSASFYALKGRYLNDVKEYHSSVTVSKKALMYARAANSSFEEANILFQLGRSQFSLGNFTASLDNFLTGLELSRSLRDKARERNFLNYIARAYSENKNYRGAAEYFDLYSKLSDSLHESEIKKTINEIENRFQSKQKADSILVLQKNSELQQLAIRKKEGQNVITIIGALSVLMIGVLLYRNLNNRHRLLKQSDQLREQEIVRLEKEQQLIAAHSLMKGQEEERSRLAKDLHDGVGGLLSGVKFSLSSMVDSRTLAPENEVRVSGIINELDSSIRELRSVSHNMMPEALINFGLKEALENYCENINLSGKLRINLQTYGLEQRMNQDEEISIYRIVQELLNNIIKHSNAKNVLIQLTREDRNFSLTVEDDGRGFDLKNAEAQHTAGINNIRSRAQFLNGTVDFQSAPGEGTSVTIIGRCC